MPLLREREVDEHRPTFGILVILEPFDADVIEICHGAIVALSPRWTPAWTPEPLPVPPAPAPRCCRDCRR